MAFSIRSAKPAGTQVLPHPPQPSTEDDIKEVPVPKRSSPKGGMSIRTSTGGVVDFY